MTTTKSILNVTATPVTTEVPTLDRTYVALISNVVSANGNDREAMYQVAAGDEDFPMSIRCRIQSRPSKNNGQGEIISTYQIETFAMEVDDTTSETLWTGPVLASLQIRMPGQSAVLDTDDFMSLLGNLYTAYFSGVDGSNEPTTSVVDRLKFNIPVIA